MIHAECWNPKTLFFRRGLPNQQWLQHRKGIVLQTTEEGKKQAQKDLLVFRRLKSVYWTSGYASGTMGSPVKSFLKYVASGLCNWYFLGWIGLSSEESWEQE